MSYNYDQCVQSIQALRRKAFFNDADDAAATAAAATTRKSTPDLEALQQCMDEFASLSKHCPMTPLLWMQYAHDTEELMGALVTLESESAESGEDPQGRKVALESSTGILELALAEFPGCALLHLYYLESLCEFFYVNSLCGDDIDQATFDKLNAAFETAWQCVGRGTHVNEGGIVSKIYNLHGYVLVYRLSSLFRAKDESGVVVLIEQLSNLFLKWSKTPIGEGFNDDMMEDMEILWDKASMDCVKRKYQLDEHKNTLWASIDRERKTTSSLMNILSSNENEIDVAMSNEGITFPRDVLYAEESEGGSNDGADHIQSLKRSNSKWTRILLSDTARFLVGLGGMETSRAFLKSASFLQRTYQGRANKGNGNGNSQSAVGDLVATHGYSFINSMYERALSECPTVESLWVKYIEFLRGEWICLRSEIRTPQLQQDKKHSLQVKQSELSSILQSTSHRAVRNSPYSSTLFEIKMSTLGLTSLSLEPDDITAVVQEATDLGFLNHNREAMLQLRLVAILVVKRRLLGLVSLGTTDGKDYDQGQPMETSSAVSSKKKSTNSVVLYQSLDQRSMEEAQDLLDDIRDMYHEAENFLYESYPTWSEGKASYWKHRALTEAYVLSPISLALKKHSHSDGMTEGDRVADKEAIGCFEKLIKTQKPSHPDSFREYIRYVTSSQLCIEGCVERDCSQPDSVASVASTIRETRGLYQKAMSSVKKAGQELSTATENKQAWMTKRFDGIMMHRNYDAALLDLSQEYLDFERNYGSEESLSQAQNLVQSKFQGANLTPLQPSPMLAAPAEESHGKRKLAEGHSQNDEGADGGQSNLKKPKRQSNLKQPKKSDGLHKVKVGKMEYPAHPFTIHVSNLNKQTQDMDLVDLFRVEVGAIVHAKVLREKKTGVSGHHFHGESKGSGLVQFEDRKSVEQALQKDGMLELGGNALKIQRSHMPAVGLVPPGMHRVNPKGEGKMSKRNKIRKGSKMNVDTGDKMEVDVKGHSKSRAQKASSTDKDNRNITSPSNMSLSALSFKPRAMKQKPKISLGR